MLDIRYMGEYVTDLAGLSLNSPWMDITMDINDAGNTGRYESNGFIWDFQNYGHLCSMFANYNQMGIFMCFLEHVESIPGDGSSQKLVNFLNVASRFISESFNKGYLGSRVSITGQQSGRNRKSVEEILEEEFFFFKFRFTSVNSDPKQVEKEKVVWCNTTFIYPRHQLREKSIENLLVEVHKYAMNIVDPKAIPNAFDIKSSPKPLSWMNIDYLFNDKTKLLTTLYWKTGDIGPVSKENIRDELKNHRRDQKLKSKKVSK